MPTTKPAEPAEVDLTDVGEPIRYASRKRMPAGDYHAETIGVVETRTKDDDRMWVYTVKLLNYPVATYDLRFMPEMVSNLPYLREFLAACHGKEIPKKKHKIDPNKYVNRKIGVSLDDTEYNDQEQSQIVKVMPVGDVQEQAVEEPPARQARAKGNARPTTRRRSEPEPEDDVSDADMDELDLDDMEL